MIFRFDITFASRHRSGMAGVIAETKDKARAKFLAANRDLKRADLITNQKSKKKLIQNA